MFADDLRKSILQAAIQGKLTEQLPTDGDAKVLLADIQAERAKLIKQKKIKAAPPLPPISPEEIPFDIPENWQWVRLDDICQINPRNKVNNENITASFLPMTNICAGYQNFYNPLIRNWKDIKNGFTHFADGDIIFAKITPCFQNIKSVYVQNLENGIGAGTTELFVIRSYGGYIFGKYLLYFVKNPNFINDGVKNFKGTAGQQRISSEFVKNYLIPVPPFSEQERIVAKVEKLLAEIEPLAEAERELEKLEKDFPRKLKASLLQAAIQGKLSEQLPTDVNAKDLLKDIQIERAKLIKQKKIKAAPPLQPISPEEIPFDIPENWQWVRLGDIGIFISGYTPKNDELCNAGKIPYFKVADMNSAGNEIWLCKTNLFLKDELNKKVYEKNLIVYPKNGGAIFTNKRRILKQDSVVDLNTGGFKIIGNVDLMYVFNYFLTIDFRFLYKGTALPTVDNKKLFERLIPVPPLAEQKRIVARLDELLQEIEI